MSSPLIVPIFQFPAGEGVSTVGYKVNTFAAGTATPQATWTDSTLSVLNANPVVMNANGQANIWLGNAAYKFVGTDATGSVLWTVDNVTQASLGASSSEWVSFNAVPTFIGATSFSLLSIPDLTASPYFISIGTRIRTANTGGTIYGTVTSVSGSVLTVKNDSGVIDSGISSASYGILANANNTSAPRRTLVVVIGGANTTLVNGVATNISGAGTIVVDYLGEGFTGMTASPLVAGTYRVWGTLLFNEGAATTGIQNAAQVVAITRAGSAVVSQSINWIPAASIASTQAIPFNGTFTITAAQSIGISVTATFTGTAPTASVASFNVERLL